VPFVKNEAPTDYASLDRPEILMNLFHPRRDWQPSGAEPDGKDILIPVDEGIVVGGREHVSSKGAPTILFFHGNGEIASDYDEIAPFYNHHGINFICVDYRGYGVSQGEPTVSNMMRDAHRVFDFVKVHRLAAQYTGTLIVMGRSLGSASALELAFHHQDRMDGLIIESGFAFAGPLLRLLGVNTAGFGLDESAGFGNVSKMKTFLKPTLVIHAEYDHIIPFSDGETLFHACPATDKTLLKIPGANHNNILALGLSEYMKAIHAFSEKIAP